MANNAELISATAQGALAARSVMDMGVARPGALARRIRLNELLGASLH